MADFVRRFPPTRASLTLVRDILTKVLRKAERDWPTTVPLLRKQVADIDRQLQQFDGYREEHCEVDPASSRLCRVGTRGCEKAHQYDGSPS